MSEAVYHLDGVRFKALACLRTHGPSTVEQIADGVWAIKAPVRAAA